MGHASKLNELRDAALEDQLAKAEALQLGMVATRPLSAQRLGELCALGEQMKAASERLARAERAVRSGMSGGTVIDITMAAPARMPARGPAQDIPSTVLHAISYTSSTVHTPPREQIERLLDKARERNRQQGVTGVLLYCEGTFHQYLEGPATGLARVYAAILRDPLHHSICELSREPVAQREFDDWSMGYRGIGPGHNAANDVAPTALLCHHARKASPGRVLLNAFWTSGMRSR